MTTDGIVMFFDRDCSVTLTRVQGLFLSGQLHSACLSLGRLDLSRMQQAWPGTLDAGTAYDDLSQKRLTKKKFESSLVSLPLSPPRTKSIEGLNWTKLKCDDRFFAITNLDLVGICSCLKTRGEAISVITQSVLLIWARSSARGKMRPLLSHGIANKSRKKNVGRVS